MIKITICLQGDRWRDIKRHKDRKSKKKSAINRGERERKDQEKQRHDSKTDRGIINEHKSKKRAFLTWSL